MTSQPSAGRPSDRVRIGIAGLGAVAQAVHLPLIERLRDAFAIDAIADLSPSLTSAIGERYQVPPDRRFDTVEALVGAAGLDAVAILTSGSHAPAVDLALDAGLPVFAEKPLAYTLAEIDAIERRLAGASRARLQLGYMKLDDPAVVHARRVADERGYGPPRAIEVTVLHPTSEAQLAHARLLPPPDDIPVRRARSAHRPDGSAAPRGAGRRRQHERSGASTPRSCSAASSTSWRSSGRSPGIRPRSTLWTYGPATRGPHPSS